MQSLVLFFVLMGGSVYGMSGPMDEVTPALETEQTLNQPERPAWRCPDCGVSELPEGTQGAMICEGCKKIFEFVDVEGTIEDGKKAILRFWFITSK